MPLADFMDTTATTKRLPALSGGKVGDPVENLTALSIVAPQLLPGTSQQQMRQTLGIQSMAVYIWRTYTESHTHTDSSVEVTQMPDIVRGDQLIVGSTTYTVKLAEQNPATTAYGATLVLYLVEDKST